jgi:hypothetical protein
VPDPGSGKNHSGTAVQHQAANYFKSTEYKGLPDLHTASRRGGNRRMCTSPTQKKVFSTAFSLKVQVVVVKHKKKSHCKTDMHEKKSAKQQVGDNIIPV